MDGEQPAGEPKWWSPTEPRAGMRGGAADKEVQLSGHRGWGKSRGLGIAAVSPGRWPHRRPGDGLGASNRETPGSTTVRPGSADRHWSKGWCGGPSYPFFLCLLSLFFPSLSLSPHLTLSAHTHIYLTINQQIFPNDYMSRNKKKKAITIQFTPSPLFQERNTTWFEWFSSAGRRFFLRLSTLPQLIHPPQEGSRSIGWR